MAKRERGLPDSFDITVPQSGPVQLGDYLDEELATPPAPPRRPAEPAAEPPAETPPSMATFRPLAVPRKQINMSPETLRMVDELLSHVRSYSMEKDIRASELFHALVLTVYEARGHLDLSGLPRRGRWGSPTAAALPVALKNTFQEAVNKLRTTS